MHKKQQHRAVYFIKNGDLHGSKKLIKRLTMKTENIVDDCNKIVSTNKYINN